MVTDAGDAQRALDSFTLGANIRQESKRGNRMYGMWFIDYFHCFQIALTQSRLGNWEKAYEAIKTSESFGEFSPSGPDYDVFANLDSLIARRLINQDS